MATQIVVSRIQNRRGTQATFDSLYVPGAPDDQKLQQGEIGLCTDTDRVFIGTVDVDNPLEISVTSTPVGIDFTPLIIDLVPAASWTTISELSYTMPASSPNTIGLLNILYSLELLPFPGFVKNGTLTVTSLISNASLTDSGNDINFTFNNISYKAIVVSNVVQIQYMHDFGGTVRMSTTTLQWNPF